MPARALAPTPRLPPCLHNFTQSCPFRLSSIAAHMRPDFPVPVETHVDADDPCNIDWRGNRYAGRGSAPSDSRDRMGTVIFTISVEIFIYSIDIMDKIYFILT